MPYGPGPAVRTVSDGALVRLVYGRDTVGRCMHSTVTVYGTVPTLKAKAKGLEL